MNVGQLIERLRAFPSELPVIVNARKNEMANGDECGEVEQLTQRHSFGSWFVDHFPDAPLEDGDVMRQAVNVSA